MINGELMVDKQKNLNIKMIHQTKILITTISDGPPISEMDGAKRSNG